MTKVVVRGGDGQGSKAKKTQGRKKLPLKRINDPNKLQVCFSKRRKGLFKKAQEVAVLCGAQVFVAVFSPAGRPYSYGYPSVPVVVDRFLNPSAYDAEAAAKATLRIKAGLEGLERQAKDLEEELLRRKGSEELGEVAVTAAAGVWVDGDVQRWDLQHLEAALPALESVQVEAAERLHGAILAQEAMMMQCAGGTLLHCLGSGSFTADGPGSHDVMAMDTTMRLMGGGAGSLFDCLGSCSFTNGTTPMNLMGGNVCHALAPTMPPGPPLDHSHGYYNNQGDGDGDDHSHGCYYSQGDGDYHGRAHVDLYQTEGVYGTACDFFG